MLVDSKTRRLECAEGTTHHITSEDFRHYKEFVDVAQELSDVSRAGNLCDRRYMDYMADQLGTPQLEVYA
uniref:Uncharacterized protein n=1 Tax=Parascaris equorum TaxID=6256 RepID=A0A914S415_PAREQ